MNKANDMQTKKVFSVAEYLASMMKICDDTDIQDIITAINPKGWVWDCDGKTIEECCAMAYAVFVAGVLKSPMRTMRKEDEGK